MEGDSTAFGHRDAPFIVNAISLWQDPAVEERQIGWARATSTALQPYATGAAYLNFLGDEGDARIRAAYGEQKYARLAQLKQRYDPGNLFRLNQNIRPNA
jgi:FAD/FMN-containing dehydrogenase